MAKNYFSMDDRALTLEVKKLGQDLTPGQAMAVLPRIGIALMVADQLVKADVLSEVEKVKQAIDLDNLPGGPNGPNFPNAANAAAAPAAAAPAPAAAAPANAAAAAAANAVPANNNRYFEGGAYRRNRNRNRKTNRRNRKNKTNRRNRKD